MADAEDVCLPIQNAGSLWYGRMQYALLLRLYGTHRKKERENTTLLMQFSATHGILLEDDSHSTAILIILHNPYTNWLTDI